MRGVTLALLVVSAVTSLAPVLAEPPQKYDLAKLHRLSAALENSNYANLPPGRITVWLQGGGVGTSATSDRQMVDLTNAIKMWNEESVQNVDFENVALLRADTGSIQFVDMQEFVKSNKPSGIIVKSGDLVALLLR